MDETERSLWAVVEENPADGTPRLALADWYDEHDQPDKAYALRWSVRHKKFPRITPKGRTAVWELFVKRRHRVDKPHLLPLTIIEWMKTRSRTIPEAFHELAIALADLRRIVE